MSETPTEDYLAMARSMRYVDLVKKFIKRWDRGSLGAGLILYLWSA